MYCKVKLNLTLLQSALKCVYGSALLVAFCFIDIVLSACTVLRIYSYDQHTINIT